MLFTFIERTELDLNFEGSFKNATTDLENQSLKKDKNLRSLSSEATHAFLTLAKSFLSLREERIFTSGWHQGWQQLS